jgi:pimeloyl-ACP methyl ester carboxylesterase
MRISIVSLGVLALVAASPLPARAACPPPDEQVICDGGLKGSLKTYLHIANPSASDTRASENGDCGFEVRLRGWWYHPDDSTKPANGFPTIVYNHGSEEMPESGDKCSVAEAFVKQGFAVFVPHRRGHGKSTGIYYEDYVAQQTALPCLQDPVNCSYYKRSATMSYLHEQAQDVKKAFSELQTGYARVNPNKMSILGYSFGGMVSLFANELDLGHKAVVVGAPGALSWDSDPAPVYPLQKALYQAIDNAKRPIFFFQTNNDASVAPTYQLSHYGWSKYKDRHQATLYSPVKGLVCEFPDPNTGATVTCGTNEPKKKCPADPSTGEVKSCGKLAHGEFASKYVETWAPAVKEFLDRNGAK